MYKIVLFVWGYSISGKIYATKEEALVPLEKLQEATRKTILIGSIKFATRISRRIIKHPDESLKIKTKLPLLAVGVSK